jgi:hypothetical protein
MNEMKIYHTSHRNYRPTHQLSGTMRFSICGAAFQRKNGGAPGYKKHMRICSTFNGIGKKYCTNQQIPENILLEKIEKAVGFAGLKQIVATGSGALSLYTPAVGSAGRAADRPDLGQPLPRPKLGTRNEGSRPAALPRLRRQKA